MPNKWDEEHSEEEVDSGNEKTNAAPVLLGLKKKWDDEEEEDDVLDSWDAADDSEEEAKKASKAAEKAAAAAAAAAAAKKSKTERIAEHQAVKDAIKEQAQKEKEALENETPAERRERERLRQLEGDLKHAEDLFSAVGIGAGSGGTKNKAITVVDPNDASKSIDLSSLPLFKPSGKEAFNNLLNTLAPLLTANAKKAHYPLFVQDLARAITKEMSSEQIKKVASVLTTQANEKMREEKAQEKGGKKTKGAKAKTALVAAGKEADKVDTTNYDNSYDDL
ncbi:phosphopyruvate hydratase [Rhizina undulata]